MAQKTINLGTGELTGDGESIRSAFDKVNDNFNEIYNTGIVGNTITADVNGTIFADDSTLLVDAVNGKIVGIVDTNTIATSSGNLTITADNYVRVDSDNNGQIEIGRNSGVGNVIIGNSANGTDIEFKGDVIMAAGTSISGYISLATLKAEVAASVDFTDFQTRIAAL